MKNMKKFYLLGVSMLLVCTLLSGCDGTPYGDDLFDTGDLMSNDACVDIKDPDDRKTCYFKVKRAEMLVPKSKSVSFSFDEN